jgi:predicted component of type VI protein secretion system
MISPQIIHLTKRTNPNIFSREAISTDIQETLIKFKSRLLREHGRKLLFSLTP